MATQLSILVPVAPGDLSWMKLLSSLDSLRAEAEIIFTSPTDISLPLNWKNRENVKILRSAPGRGQQMNLAAALAEGEYLWFLHADSQFSPTTLSGLRAVLSKRSKPAVYYFDLRFDASALSLMRVTELGVWFRSHCLKIPFGDQGLLMKREVFSALGTYKEGVSYGEDHLLIWEARCRGIPILPVRATLCTSARKYREQGWWRTTGRHLRLTWKQALPEGQRWWKERTK